jgi:hypothetical protein
MNIQITPVKIFFRLLIKNLNGIRTGMESMLIVKSLDPIEPRFMETTVKLMTGLVFPGKGIRIGESGI